MKITAVGSIAYDTISTPFVKGKDILGGSLTYFSLAASFFVNTGIIGIVGTDFKSKDLNLFSKHKINLDGLSIVPGKTFRWSGRYGFDLNQRQTLSTHLNVFQNFNPLIPPQYSSSDYLFLGNIDPDLQFQVLNQIKKPKLVVVDTMNYWIERKPKSLLKILKFTDILIINEPEARELARTPNLLKAANIIKKMLAKANSTLIIKQGEYGCFMFNGKSSFSLPAYPLKNVYDPTGAGDAFAGGVLGYLASKKTLDEKTFKQAIIYGTVMASFAVEKLGPNNLTGLKKSQIENRASKLQQIIRL